MPNFLLNIEQQVTLLKPFYFTIPILLFFTFLVQWFFYNNNNKTLRNLPPSPPKLPIIGNLHQLGTYPHRSLQKLSQRYGPVMFLSLGGSPAVVISSPNGAREIMQTHDIITANRPPSKMLKKLLYNMQDVGSAPYGEYWRQLKSICTLQLLSKKKVFSFRKVREEETAVAMETISDRYCSLSKPVNLSEMFASITRNVVCRAAFRRKYDGAESEEKFRQLFLDLSLLLSSVNAEDFFPWLSWVNQVNGKNAMADRVAREFDEFLDAVVEEAIGRLERNNNSENDYEELDNEDVGSEAMIDILVRIFKDNKASIPLGRDSVKAIIMDMFAAGTGTVSTVLEWAMTELMKNPPIMKKLQDEVRGITNAKEYVNEDDIQSMPYLKSLLKETLRLHPPNPTIVPRTSTQDINVMGYDIPAESLILINAWAIARDPSLWDDPEEFKTERFLNSSIDFKGQDFEFIPFGAGRRGCPGISFAMSIIELALANMVHRFDWKLPDGMKGDDLDMTECEGLTVHRKIPLLAIPIVPS